MKKLTSILKNQTIRIDNHDSGHLSGVQVYTFIKF